jgi:hypothetical protein
MKNVIIINADDFGYSQEINKAILESFNENLISSSTLLTNMKGFEDACEKIKSLKLNNRVGIHLNLTEGEPLTENIKKFPDFYKDGIGMYKSFKGYFLENEVKNVIYNELEAQIIKYYSFIGKPTHLDTHHHVHLYSLSLQKIFISLAKKFKIPAIRISFNCGKNLSWKRKLYSFIYNKNLSLNNLAKVKFFCEIRSITPQILNKSCPIEIMVHPFPGAKGLILNYRNGEDLRRLIEQKITIKKRLVSYYEIT